MQLTWEVIMEKVASCTSCELHKGRSNTVFGEGNKNADILFVGEGPGYEEDKQGRPFVGPAGQLLDKMLSAIHLTRENIFIANIVKCRPPGNRAPLEEEAISCLPYLRAQTALLKPQIIVCLGATAAKYIYREDVRISKERGIIIEKRGVAIIPTYHPAALLRDETKKRDAWQDMQAIEKMYAAVQHQAAMI